jgi:hypothetical protein
MRHGSEFLPVSTPAIAARRQVIGNVPSALGSRENAGYFRFSAGIDRSKPITFGPLPSQIAPSIELAGRRSVGCACTAQGKSEPVNAGLQR